MARGHPDHPGGKHQEGSGVTRPRDARPITHAVTLYCAWAKHALRRRNNLGEALMTKDEKEAGIATAAIDSSENTSTAYVGK